MYDCDGRRRRPAVSCALCRKRKIRCNRERPCSNCVRSKSEVCVYENPLHHLPPSPRHHAAAANGAGADPAPRRSRDSMMPVDALDGTSVSSTSTSGGSSMQATSSSTTSNTSTSTTPMSHNSSSSSSSVPGNAESIMLRRRVRQLEEQLARSTLGSGSAQPHSPVLSNVETTSSRLAGTYHIYYQNDQSGQQPSIARNVTHKARLVGGSHWGVNGVLLLRDIFEPIEARMLEREEPSTAWPTLEKCKCLARVIKARRAPKWPTPPTPDLPPREVADALVECYLATTEAIYRILHVPSFRRDYEALWAARSESTASNGAGGGASNSDSRRSMADTAFLVQLKLVLAIGATTYDDTFSLRVSAVRWVYEALTWVAEPAFKSRLNLASLQTDILLLIAQERVDIGADAAWISVGTLLRRAVHMGLHRDPARLAPVPPRTCANGAVLMIEMRRRLWNTIIELALHASLVLGAPPFVSLADFDTAPPGNFDDEQLEGCGDASVPGPAARFTQTSVAVVLRRSFPCRLAVVKFLNDLASSGTYEETLRLDGELRAAYRDLRRALQTYSSNSNNNDSSGNDRSSNNDSSNGGDGNGDSDDRAGRSEWGTQRQPSPSTFEIQVVDFLMHRYISALHIPYFSLALHETAYAYSRKVVIESSLKIWRSVCPSSSPSSSSSSSFSFSSPTATTHSHSSTSSDIETTTTSSSQPITPPPADLARLTTCSGGFFPSIANHAALLITVELRAQLQEEEGLSLGPGTATSTLRPDLVCVLDEAKAWCMRALRAGETNVKRYLLVNLVATDFDRLARGLGADAGGELMLRTAEKVVAACVPMLEEMVANLGGGGESEVGGEVIGDVYGEDGGGGGLLQPGGGGGLGLASEVMMMDDWDFMSSDVLLSPGGDPASWLFDDGVNTGMSALW